MSAKFASTSGFIGVSLHHRVWHVRIPTENWNGTNGAYPGYPWLCFVLWVS